MVTNTPLRDLVEQRLAGRWEDWARQHPALAAAIDRTRMIEQAVTLLQDDPRFVAAMRQAGVDEAKLAIAAEVLELMDRWIALVLPA